MNRINWLSRIISFKIFIIVLLFNLFSSFYFGLIGGLLALPYEVSEDANFLIVMFVEIEAFPVSESDLKQVII